MSWGERSCKKPCRCPKQCSMSTCNVNCQFYKWDGVTKPDTVKLSDGAIKEQLHYAQFNSKDVKEMVDKLDISLKNIIKNTSIGKENSILNLLQKGRRIGGVKVSKSLPFVSGD